MSGYRRRSRNYHDDRAYESRAPPAGFTDDAPSLLSRIKPRATSPPRPSWREPHGYSTTVSSSRGIFDRCRFYLEYSRDSGVRKRDLLLQGAIKSKYGQIVQEPSQATHILLTSPDPTPPDHIMIPRYIDRPSAGSRVYTTELLVWEYGKVYEHAEAVSILNKERKKDVVAVWKDWAWRCVDEGRSVSTAGFEVIGLTGTPPSQRPPTPPLPESFEPLPPRQPHASASYQPRSTFTRNGQVLQPESTTPLQHAPAPTAPALVPPVSRRPFISPFDPRLRAATRLPSTSTVPGVSDSRADTAEAPVGTWSHPARLDQSSTTSHNRGYTRPPDNAFRPRDPRKIASHAPVSEPSPVARDSVPQDALPPTPISPTGPSRAPERSQPSGSGFADIHSAIATAGADAKPGIDPESSHRGVKQEPRSPPRSAVQQISSPPPSTATDRIERSITPVPAARKPTSPPRATSRNPGESAQPSQVADSSKPGISPRHDVRSTPASPIISRKRKMLDPAAEIAPPLDPRLPGVASRHGLPTPATSAYSQSASPQTAVMQRTTLPLVRESTSREGSGVSTSAIPRNTQVDDTAEHKIFQNRFGVPYSFHFLHGGYASLLSKHSLLIEQLGGGELVPVQEATYIIMKRDPGFSRLETEEDEVAFRQVTNRASRACVSYMWIDECTSSGVFLDHRPFEIRFDGGEIDEQVPEMDPIAPERAEVEMGSDVDGEDEDGYSDLIGDDGRPLVDVEEDSDSDEDDDLLDLASNPDISRARAKSTPPSTPQHPAQDSYNGAKRAVPVESESDELESDNEEYIRAAMVKKPKMRKKRTSSGSGQVWPKVADRLAEEDEERYALLLLEVDGWLKNPECGRTMFLSRLDTKLPSRTRWEYFFKKYQTLLQEERPGLKAYVRHR